MQAIGYDTGVVNYIAFRDKSGLVVSDLFIQSLSTVLTNPDNDKTIEVRYALAWKQTFTDNPDGSFLIRAEVTGLNFLYRGETVVTLAGRSTFTVLVTFDKRGNPSVSVVEELLTPHMAHANAYLCDLLS